MKRLASQFRNDQILALLWAVFLSLALTLPAAAALIQCDPEVDVEVFDAPPVVEGDVGRRNAVFRVVMTHPGLSVSGLLAPCSVDLTFGTPRGKGSATAGTDYLPRGGSLTLTPGQPEARVGVPVLGDREVEPDEDFFLVVTLVDPPPEARLVRSTGRALIIDDDEAHRLEVIGEVTRSAKVGETVGLAVRVLGSDDRGVGDQPVDWRVVEGRAVLDPGAPGGDSGSATRSFTARDGVARQPVQARGRPGIVRVVASVPAMDLAVEITIDARGDLGCLVPECLSGPASVAGALDVICRDAAGGMTAFCDYLFELPDPEQRAVVLAATPRQAAAVGHLAVHAGHNQVDSLADRLRSRRRAAAGAFDDGAEEGGPHAARGRLLDLRLAGPVQAGPLRQATLRRIGPGISAARHLDEESYLAAALAPAAVQVEEPLEEHPAEPAYDFDPPSRLGFFVSGRTTSGDRPGTLDEAGFNADVVGVTAGLDYLLGPRAVVGAAAGWLDTGADFFGRGGELDGESWSLSAYGTVFDDAAYAELVVSGGRNDFTQSRGIDLPVPFAGADRYVATADLEGDQWSATLTAGADRAFGALTLEGFARGSWVGATFDAYRERGAGPFDLAVEKQTVESLQGEAGVRMTYAASYPWGVLQPQARASYVHEFEDDVRLIRARFVEDVQALELVIPTEARDADFANAGAGATATFAGGRSLYVFYDRDLSRGGLEMETLTFGLRLEL